ncbi:MAG: FKBP-type peptidyl-prolyl cis-trans isomerase [Opitutaceae bacterium]|nr:FKBP-type peptidyl-prolyl cis-trans isomerase [Opitutaceae bacterium]
MQALRTILLFCLLLAPAVVFAQREKLPPEDLEIVEKTWPTAKRTSTGLRTMILQDSDGPSPKKGDMVSVVYVGKLLDGTIFDQATDPEKPFTFRIGRGQVIEGWEEGTQLLKVGQRRLFIVPYELGYGTRGNPPKIPRRATLVFEVELLAINPPAPAPPSAPTN